jgi:hypothetical protein
VQEPRADQRRCCTPLDHRKRARRLQEAAPDADAAARAAAVRGNPLRDENLQPLRLSERTINHSIQLLALILDEGVRRPDIAPRRPSRAGQEARDQGAEEGCSRLARPDEILSLLEAAELIDNPLRPKTLRKAD